MSRVRSDKFTNRAATGPCTFTHGMHSTDTAGTGIGVSLGYGGIVAVGATISGNLSVGGTITYEDTTNVDSTGIVTARNGIKVGQPTGVGATFNPAGDLVVAGVTTVGTGLSMPDNAKAYFGNSGDLQIYHDGSNSYIEDAGTGVLQLNTNYLQVKNAADDETILAASQNGSVSLYYDNTKRFETISTGVTITGNLQATHSTDNDIYLNAGDGCIEITRSGAAAFIDFKNSTSEDYDARLQESSGGITCSGALSDSKGDVRDIPYSGNSGAYTLVAADAGKVVGGDTSWAIPASTFSAGNAVTLLNLGGTDLTLDASALTYLWNTADGVNIKASTLTLGARTMATVYFKSANEAFIQAAKLNVS